MKTKTEQNNNTGSTGWSRGKVVVTHHTHPHQCSCCSGFYVCLAGCQQHVRHVHLYPLPCCDWQWKIKRAIPPLKFGCSLHLLNFPTDCFGFVFIQTWRIEGFNHASVFAQDVNCVFLWSAVDKTAHKQMEKRRWEQCLQHWAIWHLDTDSLHCCLVAFQSNFT